MYARALCGTSAPDLPDQRDVTCCQRTGDAWLRLLLLGEGGQGIARDPYQFI